MIKVKIDRPAPNVFYVEDGFTVTYADDVLEVLNADDETIAVFRSWLYAMPAEEIEEEELEEEEDLPSDVLTLGGIDVLEGDFLTDSDTASYAHVNTHGAHEAPDDETEAPVS